MSSRKDSDGKEKEKKKKKEKDEDDKAKKEKKDSKDKDAKNPKDKGTPTKVDDGRRRDASPLPPRDSSPAAGSELLRRSLATPVTREKSGSIRDANDRAPRTLPERLPKQVSSTLRDTTPGTVTIVEDEAIWETDPVAGTRKIVAGTLEKLVEVLTDDNPSNQDFIKVFLYTYRLFSNHMALMDALIARARNIIAAQRSTTDEQALGSLKTQQLRTAVVLKYWFQHHWARDFDGDANKEVLQKVEAFLPAELAGSAAPAAVNSLLSLISSLKTKKQAEYETTKELKPPEPKITDMAAAQALLEKGQFWLIPVGELGRQITLIEHERFAAVADREFMQQAWLKADKNTRAPGIVETIRRFNQVSEWCTSEILLRSETAERVACLEYFMDLLKECMTLNNFSTALQLISALQRPPIQRLKDTWALANQEKVKEFEATAITMEPLSNWKKARELLSKAVLPCIPYLGIYLTDLVYVEEGNQATEKGKNGATLINFERYRRFGNLIQEIRMYQATKYLFKEIPFVRNFLLKVNAIPDFRMYELSETIQPRKGNQRSQATTNESKVQNALSLLRVILQEQFEKLLPEQPIKTWSCRAPAGTVYLWAEDLRLEYVEVPGHATYVLSSQVTLSKAELATLCRTAQFFAACHLNPITVKGLVASLETGEAEVKVARDNGIDVLLCDTDNKQNPVSQVHPSSSAICASTSIYRHNFHDWKAFLVECGIEDASAQTYAKQATANNVPLSQAPNLSPADYEKLSLSSHHVGMITAALAGLTSVASSAPPSLECCFARKGSQLPARSEGTAALFGSSGSVSSDGGGSTIHTRPRAPSATLLDPTDSSGKDGSSDHNSFSETSDNALSATDSGRVDKLLRMDSEGKLKDSDPRLGDTYVSS